VVEANEILQASLSTNTWNSYETGMSTFNKFRKNYNLHVVWPPPVNHISSFIAFLTPQGLDKDIDLLKVPAF
jgi:hypothetical protein